MAKNKKEKTPSERRSVPKTRNKRTQKVQTSIVPWLCVRKGTQAFDFYKAAFGAKEVFRMGDSTSVVARLSIDGAEFWLSDESPEHFNFSPESLGGITTRIILTVADPDAMFERAVKAGAKEVYPMTDEHEWRIGRVADPFGHHWEIGCPLS